MTRSISSSALLWCAAAAVAAGLWLAFDNPTIEGTSKGDYPCLAPWDTVLNSADNAPGGEPPRDADDIAQRCRDAGTVQFLESVAVVVAGLALVVAAAVVRRREERDG